MLTLPLNKNVLGTLETSRFINSSEGAIAYGETLEMRLCRRCVRTLATHLPTGMRLAGAVLRYPECAPLVKSTEELEREASDQQFIARQYTPLRTE